VTNKWPWILGLTFGGVWLTCVVLVCACHRSEPSYEDLLGAAGISGGMAFTSVFMFTLGRFWGRQPEKRPRWDRYRFEAQKSLGVFADPHWFKCMGLLGGVLTGVIALIALGILVVTLAGSFM
jgi:hypothetical protein